MKIVSVVGARPNFMKIAPFIKAIDLHNSLNKNSGHFQIDHILVNTGQHYDDRMSKAFFEELGIPEADINLEIGSGTHAEQVGYTMIEFEKVLKQHNPDWVVVVGDVNATLACSVTAKKEWIKCCHIEAGLRSGDLTMPEEVNRIVTDRVSDLLLTPDRISSQNLRNEGMPEKSIALVGNIMIDTLDANLQKAQEILLRQSLEKNWLAGELKDLSALPYGLITLHRPANVDHYEVLNPLVDFLISEVGEQMHLVWPIHPRTFKQIKLFGLWEKIRDSKNVTLLHPLGYLEMLRFNMDARMILTDSGGLQEESMVLGTPCITMRWTTERPVTLRKLGGTSTLVGNDLNLIREEFYRALSSVRNPSRPEFWDGHTAERVLETILKYN